jgi:DNA-binding CsgD family transcriptional regulator
VISVAGSPAESEFSFAALERLVRPLFAGMDDLPPAYVAALRAVTEMDQAAEADLFVLGRATLSLLEVSAAQSPVLVALDDADCIDRPSAEVLAFVARRIHRAQILIVTAGHNPLRGASDDSTAIELYLDELDAVASERLLDIISPDLSPPLREWVLECAAGNPLALTELPTALAARQSPAVPTDLRVPLTARLAAAFGPGRWHLPEESRALLLVAAAEDGCSIAEALDAASYLTSLDDLGDALERTRAARLIQIDGTDFRFTHALVRAAVYEGASHAQRARAHGAIAATLQGQQERIAWHEAATLLRPAEAAAASLETAALRQASRGKTTEALAAWERAATLSEDHHRRISRLLEAAELAGEVGARPVLIRTLEKLNCLETTAPQRARAASILARFETGAQPNRMQVISLVDLASEQVDAGEVGLALDLLTCAAVTAHGFGTGADLLPAIHANARRISRDGHDVRFLAIQALAAPRGCDPRLSERVLDFATRDRVTANDRLLLGMAASALGDPSLAMRVLADAATELRDQGRQVLLARALIVQAWAAIETGNWALASAVADEGGRIARNAGQDAWATLAQLATAALAAGRGHEVSAAGLADEAELNILQLNLSGLARTLQLVRGLVASGGRRFVEAHDHLRSLVERDDTSFSEREGCHALTYFIDAAIESGHAKHAEAVVAEFERCAALNRRASLRARIAYSRARLADTDPDADTRYSEALAATSEWPFMRARLELAQGTSLRRRRRVADARSLLRSAAEACDSIGAAPWAEAARLELRASGETIRRHTAFSQRGLTPQELQIAHMAAKGLSNREIGKQIHLSHRTVGSHLYRIFPKMGITSRGALGLALAEVDAHQD